MCVCAYVTSAYFCRAGQFAYRPSGSHQGAGEPMHPNSVEASHHVACSYMCTTVNTDDAKHYT